MRTLREMGVDKVVGYFESQEVAEANLATESYANRTAAEMVGAIQSGDVRLVDVRRQAEWDDGHIPQASYSFLGSMLDDAGSLANDKPIVFQCRSGARSAVACSIAQAKGIKNVINLDGGIVQWELQGYPVITENPQPVG